MTNPAPDHSKTLTLGIDVGGTDVKLGLVDASGSILNRHRTPTPQLGTPSRVFQYAISYAQQKLSELGIPASQLRATGLAVPGVLDAREFVLREVVNLPGWQGVSLLTELQAATRLPSTVINDANSAAFAEYTMRGLTERSLALVTLGTGIGCGIVVAGKPCGGDHGSAGELGHIAIDFGPDALPCTCGSRGHLESYAGAGGVIARLKHAIDQAGSTAVPSTLLLHDLSPRTIADEAASGNEICQQVITDTAHYVGRAIGLLGQVVDPAVVLLGGAMTFGGSSTVIGQRFIATVRETVKATTLVQVGGNVQIEFATLGNDAGMLGAAMLSRQSLQVPR